jgi:hypothetical protein
MKRKSDITVLKPEFYNESGNEAHEKRTRKKNLKELYSALVRQVYRDPEGRTTKAQLSSECKPGYVNDNGTPNLARMFSEGLVFGNVIPSGNKFPVYGRHVRRDLQLLTEEVKGGDDAPRLEYVFTSFKQSRIVTSLGEGSQEKMVGYLGGLKMKKAQKSDKFPTLAVPNTRYMMIVPAPLVFAFMGSKTHRKKGDREDFYPNIALLTEGLDPEKKFGLSPGKWTDMGGLKGTDPQCKTKFGKMWDYLQLDSLTMQGTVSDSIWVQPEFFYQERKLSSIVYPFAQFPVLRVDMPIEAEKKWLNNLVTNPQTLLDSLDLGTIDDKF